MITPFQRPDPRELDREIARVAWALLFTTLGGPALVPNVPHGTWLIATGSF